ncbi:MAG: hypothetical protein AABX11_03745 [Nanoarchaeota archaeon]
MSVMEDIQRLRAEGKPDEEIAMVLQQQGIPPQQIYDAMSQSVIRDAVNSEGSPQQEYSQTDMQPSITDAPPAQEYTQYDQNQQYAPQQQGYDQSQQYNQSYSQGLSSDTIAEIAEQTITEKLSFLKTDLEKILDFKNSMDAKVEMLDERLKRIEKIIDRLQLSILQKVGEYLTNTNDLKNELLETQKTVASITKHHQK